VADLIPAESRYPLRSAPSEGRQEFFRRHPGFVDQLYAIRDTIRKILPSFRLGMVRPRGLLIPLDPWMRGQLRWARKIGGGAAVWRPETRMKLEEGTGSGEQVFSVNLLPDSLILGTILDVSPTFKATVTDFDTQFFTVTVGEEVPKAKEAGESIKVWGWPVTVEGGVSKGTYSIRVSTPTTLPLTRGDRLQVPVDPLADAPYSFTTPHNVSKVEFVEEDVEGYKYILTLEQALARDVESSETCYMRAFPAYFSGRVSVPDYSAAFLKMIGPFLVDFMSGPLVINTEVEEFVNTRQYRADRDPITPLRASDHNGQINRMPIKAEQLLFWNKVKGVINHDGVKTVCTTDPDGLFRVVERMRPTMSVPTDQFASGSIVCIPVADLANNEGFDLYDGTNTVRFEYKVNGLYTQAPGKMTIDVSAVTTDSEVATLTATAIINSVLDFTVTQVSRVVNLVHNIPGIIGNNVINESVSDPAFVVDGMGGGGGGLQWLIVAEASGPAEIQIQLHPNDAQVWSDDPDRATEGGALTPGLNNLLVRFPPTFEPVTHFDVRIMADPGTTVKLSDWSLNGSRVAYIETQTVVRIETDQWAGSFLFLKPLWANFDLLKPFPELDLMNGGGVLL